MDEFFSKFLGPSWRTTLMGLGAVLGAIADVIISYANGTTPHWQADMAAIWTGLVGFQAKDKGVSNASTPVVAREVAPVTVGTEASKTD